MVIKAKVEKCQIVYEKNATSSREHNCQIVCDAFEKLRIEMKNWQHLKKSKLNIEKKEIYRTSTVDKSLSGRLFGGWTLHLPQCI